MIYILEDDASIRELEQYALQSNGLPAEGFGDAESFWGALETQIPELIVLDIMLPGEDGLSVLKRLRAAPATRAVPVIMVTAKDSELDVVRGLDQGADDYLAKPFGIMEFISRVRSVLRRVRRQQSEAPLQVGSIVLDDSLHTVTVDGRAVSLTFKEYEVLKLLMQKPGEAVRRETIMRQVWDTDVFVESRTLDMHMRSLRQKLGAAGGCIVTIRKVGFKIVESPEVSE